MRMSEGFAAVRSTSFFQASLKSTRGSSSIEWSRYTHCRYGLLICSTTSWMEYSWETRSSTTTSSISSTSRRHSSLSRVRDLLSTVGSSSIDCLTTCQEIMFSGEQSTQLAKAMRLPDSSQPTEEPFLPFTPSKRKTFTSSRPIHKKKSTCLHHSHATGSSATRQNPINVWKSWWRKLRAPVPLTRSSGSQTNWTHCSS